MKKLHVSIFVILGIMSLLALLPWSEHGYYYIALKWVVTGFMAYVVYDVYKEKKKFHWSIAIFCLIALLFNPIIPMQFTKEIWLIVNVLVAGALFFFAREKWLSK